MMAQHDMTELKTLQTKLLDFEFKDATTGLFNRRSFEIVLDMEIEKTRRMGPGAAFALLFVKVRNLAAVNSRYGYETGDLLLESTGIRVREAIRASDSVFRLDGTQLAVLLTTLKRPSDAAIVAENICNKASFPYLKQNGVISVACNVGISVFPNDGKSRDTLIRMASAALCEAERRDERYVIHDAQLHRKAVYKARLRADIKRALVREQFQIWFQPVVNEHGIPIGAEALLRWNHPELGWIPPAEFVPVAEESGDTSMIGRWVMFRTCRYLREWADFLDDRYVSINLSVREFNSAGLVEQVVKTLEAERVEPEALKLEITESLSMADVENTIVTIRRFLAVGIDVFVDDFGSGYSSLAYLKRLPATTIKIDKKFVDGIEDEQDDRAFIQGMIAMVKSKRKAVIVEGVARQGQFEILREMGVRRMQGFYFARPMPADRFSALLRSGAALP